MNRRREPRFEVYYRATIFSVDQPEVPFDALVLDISASGMRLVADQQLAEDKVICVEVGQHMVLAEVRSAIPRGSRFLIGAEKIHTLSLLSLPESMSTLDRIHALVDDYHVRIQRGLETENPSSIETPPPSVAPPMPERAKLFIARSINSTTNLEPEISQPASTTTVEEPLPQPDSAPISLAPSVVSEPAPADVPSVPRSAVVEVNFGQLQVILPEVADSHPALITEETAARTDEPVEKTPLVLEAPALGPMNEEPPIPTDLPPPVQPTWMSSELESTGEPSSTDTDQLRVIAAEQERAIELAPEPRRPNRFAAIIIGGLAAALILAFLLFAPFRNRILLFSSSAATERQTVKARTPSSGTTVEPPPPPEIPSDPAPPEAAPNPTIAQKTEIPKPASSTSAGVHSASIRTYAQSWVWACTDGKTLEGRVLQGGSNLEIEFSKSAKVLIGNAGAVEMALDGKPLGVIGENGQVRVAELTPQGFHIAPSGVQDCGR